MKRVVVPGEKIEFSNGIEGSYTKDGNYYSKYFGILQESENGVKIMPISGRYFPKSMDLIVGKVVSNDNFSYGVDINSFRNVNLSKRNLESSLSVGDLVLLKVLDVNEVRDSSVELVKKLYGGELIEISAKKSARVVGKSKSMLSLIEDATKSRITVGSNGYIYAIGGDLDLILKILHKIEVYSHVDNLTEKMQLYLNNSFKAE